MGIDTIYHYCSIETFYKIIKNKYIRLSDLNKTNDYMEKNWVFQYVEETLKSELENLEFSINLYEEYYYSDESNNHMEYLNEFINYSMSNSSPILISCFSKDKDLLSQWRAYGQDGLGISVGFDYAKLKLLNGVNRNFSIKNVIYKKNKQIDAIRSAVQATVGYMDDMFRKDKVKVSADFDEYFTEEFDAFCEVFIDCLDTLSCYVKNPAFSEEKEIRMIYKLGLSSEMDEDEVRQCFENDVAINQFKLTVPQFYCKNNKIVSYSDLNFEQAIPDNIIKEIVLGPKCKLDEKDVFYFLSAYGYKAKDINVTRSSATYI